MAHFGIDIGTSKICVVALDDNKKILFCESEKNFFDVDKEQNPDRIVAVCKALLQKGKDSVGEVTSIGISNQMHGILYVDKEGNAVSNLYTWQDNKGNLPYRNTTYVEYITEKTGYKVASGYGLVTHFYLQEKGLIPLKADKILTIGDYLAQKLMGTKAVMHPTNAASLGLYDIGNDEFDKTALAKLNIDSAYLPEISYHGSEIIAIGDNQASFLGAVEDLENSVLVNIGTGSQVSVLTAKTKSDFGEVRPFDKDKKLLVGAALCGGYAYTILGNFFLSVAKMMGFTPSEDIFASMARCVKEDSQVQFDTCFLGSRLSPNDRASITNLTEDNFNADNIITACQKGIVKELFDLYLSFGEKKKKVIGAGNGIRKNKLMQLTTEKLFGLPFAMTEVTEEAAIGAAVFSSKTK